MNIFIREALKTDYSIINRMLIELQNYHSENVPTTYKKIDNFFTENEYFEILKNTNLYFLLAILNEKVVGLIWLRINERGNNYEYEKKQVWIEGIYIEENFRRKGIAKFLLNEAIKKAKTLNAETIELMVWNFNENSKKFFKNYFKLRALILTKDI